MNVAEPTAAKTTHRLRASPQTVHWGYFDAAVAPALTIDSGDVVTIECVSGHPEVMPAKSSGLAVLPELEDIHARVKPDLGPHILTGPVFVRGSEIGDVLEVRIRAIELRQDWGYNIFRPYGGTIPDDFPYRRLMHIRLDRERNLAIMPSGLKFPLAPFFGELGVAPRREFGRQSSREPREFGGNLDCKELTAGSTIYLPVWNEGALFSTGDGHAAQGDGEVDGTAIETALTGTFEFIVRKDLRWNFPRAETPTHFITFGLDADLDDAARQALREMIDWVARLTRVSRDESYALCSCIADLHVTQTVNGVKGVHAMIAKSIVGS
jgi:acetamidase/formamidase